MNILLFLFTTLIFCCFQPSSSWSQDKIEAPELKIGDIWIYQTSSGGNNKSEVVQITEEGYVIKGKETSEIYDKKTMNLISVIEGNRKTKSDSISRKILDFPLFVGKKWQSDTLFRASRGQMLTCTTEYQVEALEDMQTPAGNFKAFRILAKYIIGQSRQEYWLKLWYSPAAKFWIKREIDKMAKTKEEDAVLTSYKLNDK